MNLKMFSGFIVHIRIVVVKRKSHRFLKLSSKSSVEVAKTVIRIIKYYAPFLPENPFFLVGICRFLSVISDPFSG